MIESLRAFGYDLPTAIADLVDNSISAEARNIWLTFFWNGPESHVAIADDGAGMAEADLVNAMRAGSRSPLAPRTPGDLGRFGLGLKTASFSQCRRLTVASTTDGTQPAVRRWDLDHVQKVRDWQLLREAASGSMPRLAQIGKLRHGTVVLWEQMDRLVTGTETTNKTDHQRFLELVQHVEEHLGMVFHRYLKGKGSIRLFINGQGERERVVPWDPFLEDETATQAGPVETLETSSGSVEVQEFVLPHHDRLTRDAHRAAGGPAGWNAQQGFYVYRNRRLLVPGDWLGLGFTKEEHYKLARIRVDINNAADREWDIDVKKSTARPPAHLRKRLRWIAEGVRKKAVAVYRHRGGAAAPRRTGPVDPVWNAAERAGKIGYVVNREHPLIARCLAESKELRPTLVALLRLLEETVPIRRIWLEETEKPDAHSQPFEKAPDKDISGVIRQVYAALRAAGLSDSEASERLRGMEAFAEHGHLVEAILPPASVKKKGTRS
ncbi:ATP-binding protein [Planctomyces sp. SH-PL62]|uniref:ATP-binding protein n=1 Tax=Planctomyces sp. SH-PL62 TaxID=1636152 RepID=UPI00078B5EF0|nr:ATP-binding protein [Planctomyces sp. SH-PL62]AMV40491.1 Histidine kinase-, DNA gyrase B-, and HSP90-like ATPase [Planctomyces sp. SH-PL62]